MEEKQLFCKPKPLKRQGIGRIAAIGRSFEDRLFLEAICHPAFPNLLRKRRPKACDRIQGKLESLKKDLLKLYRKEQKKMKETESMGRHRLHLPLISERSNPKVLPIEHKNKEAMSA